MEFFCSLLSNMSLASKHKRVVGWATGGEEIWTKRVYIFIFIISVIKVTLYPIIKIQLKISTLWLKCWIGEICYHELKFPFFFSFFLGGPFFWSVVLQDWGNGGVYSLTLPPNGTDVKRFKFSSGEKFTYRLM